MTSNFKRFIWSISCAALIASLCCAPAVFAKEQILKISRAGLSIWIPEKPMLTDIKDDMEMYGVKRNKDDTKGFILVVNLIDKSKRKGIDKHFLAEVVEGEQDGFQKKAKAEGKKVVSEFVSKVSGSGWTGSKYKVTIGDKVLVKQYGIFDKGIFVLTALNQGLKDSDVVRVFDSVAVESEKKIIDSNCIWLNL